MLGSIKTLSPSTRGRSWYETCMPLALSRKAGPKRILLESMILSMIVDGIWPQLLLLLLLLWISYSVIVRFVFVLSLRLPPEAGPAQQNAPNFFADQPWKMYRAWSDTLGSIFCIRATIHLPLHLRWLAWILPPPPPTIVLDGMGTITELFQKQADNFSDRPRWPMAELLGRTENVGFTYYGTRLKRKRTLLQTEFGSNRRNQWGPMLEGAVAELLSSWSKPETNGGNEARQCLRRTVESLMFRLTYGFEPSKDIIELIQLVSQQTGAAFQPGRWAVNSFPLLSYIPYWMPGAGFQRWARSAKGHFMKMVQTPYNETKNDVLTTPEVSCFVANRLRALQESGSEASPDEEQLIMSTAGSVFSAGVDTTVAAVETILVLLSRHPEKQDIAYREITTFLAEESVSISANPITLGDIERLPYISCIFKEGLRINPPVPLVAHSPLINTQYKGWSIPKGSWVLANIWSLLHNDKFYLAPETFNPERHVSSATLDPTKYAFGMGRRVCPGIPIATSFTTLVVALVLTTFSIEPIDDLTSDIEFTTGLISSPKLFSCRLVPRTKLPSSL